mgnify:CR=1 FL=1|jgi:hypothetical protein
MRSQRLRQDTNGAATELGYVFTFLLGLMFLSSFSVWVWGLEVATQDRWTTEALQENLLSVSAAVERADEAARLDPDATYAEPVGLHLSSATGLQLQMWLTDDALHLSDVDQAYRTSQPISGAAPTVHSGTVDLAGLDTIWVVLQSGNVTIQIEQPGF